MNNEKLKSFIKYAKTEMTHINCMAEHFERYMGSEIVDAKEYFTQQGLEYTVQIQPSDVEICRVLMKIFLEDTEGMEGDVTKYVIGKTIKHFKGTVDPRRVKDISKEFTK